jgi:hypothetical protein
MAGMRRWMHFVVVSAKLYQTDGLELQSSAYCLLELPTLTGISVGRFCIVVAKSRVCLAVSGRRL